MYITMHCGGMPFNGDTIKTKSLGGSETAAYYVALELAKVGHRVTLFTASQETGTFDGVKYEWAGQATEAAPLGDRFTFYAEHTPCDLLLIQRHPRAFERRWASKVNAWWVHDLALKRSAPIAQLMNIDVILPVSQFHKEQIVSTWGISPDIVKPITNGIDPALFRPYAKDEGFQMVYSSRPERGLEHLVRPGGIMHRLAKEAPEVSLVVCGYDNVTPQMADYYRYLNDCCDALPNVVRVGALTKQALADQMVSSHLLCYPTEFEEVSCITAMEAMAARLPMLTSAHGALPETCKDSGTILVPLKDGQADEDAFVAQIKALAADPAKWDKLAAKQARAAERYTWAAATQRLLDIVVPLFGAEPSKLLPHYIHTSDIAAAKRLPNADVSDELRECYAFADGDMAAHYAAYYEYEKERGVEYGPENPAGNSRFESVAGHIGALPDGSRVCDFGCAHGHYTVNLAKRFPQHRFVGIDHAQRNVDTARAWAASESLTNVEFICGSHGDLPGAFDAIIAAEVVEHVVDPQALIDTLRGHLTAAGKLIITTPYGPWEALGYREHWPWRAHLHHFERQDLVDMLGHMPGFGLVCAPSTGASDAKWGEPLGSYIVTVGAGEIGAGPIDYARKAALTVPRQTLSACLIVKDAEADIVRCLKSIVPFADEVIIGVDTTTKDRTRALIADIMRESRGVRWDVYEAESPLSVGFDAARNATLERATGDWVLWIDADEVLFGGEALLRYLRRNQYQGYAIKQHHISAQPAGVLKTDLPCRVFRNGRGVRFFGVVHEHPEVALNKGIGPVAVLPEVEIMHHGYSTEPVRRARFDRNIGLLQRDRATYPERELGKFLWIRDLAQMTQYDAEVGTLAHGQLEARRKEATALFRELLASGNTRIAVDALPYYSLLNDMAGDGFEFGFRMDASKMNGGLHVDERPLVKGCFAARDDLDKLIALVVRDKTNGFDSRYF